MPQAIPKEKNKKKKVGDGEEEFQIVSDWDSGNKEGEVRRRQVVRNKPTTGASRWGLCLCRQRLYSPCEIALKFLF